MSKWQTVESQDDINLLLEEFGGFHDSCIVNLYYESGMYVDKENSMVFAAPYEYKLHVVLQSQWNKDACNLCFEGVRRMHIAGLQDNYAPDILSCYLKFHENILPSRYSAPKEVIVFADSCDFDINNINHPLNEPETSYVIASRLKWRKFDAFKEDVCPDFFLEK
jgi:hypothetical protein